MADPTCMGTSDSPHRTEFESWGSEVDEGSDSLRDINRKGRELEMAIKSNGGIKNYVENKFEARGFRILKVLL